MIEDCFIENGSENIDIELIEDQKQTLHSNFVYH